MGRQKTAEEKSYVRAQTVWFQLHLRVLDQRRICQKKDSETGGRGGGDLSVTSENGNSNMIIQMCNKLKWTGRLGGLIGSAGCTLKNLEAPILMAT